MASRLRPANGAKRNEARQPRSTRERRRVLIVDDHAHTRELYAEFLQTWGFTVLTAANAVVAIDIARQQRPHVIVMDLSMPSLDGITAMTHLKRDPRTTRIPVIILTGYAARAIQDGALEAGADGFLTKPCLPEDLAQEVQRLVDSSDRPHPRYAS